ncbi:MAG: ABC transporter substrate-binding protein, partial [Anaerovoracaceae bacterium]
DDDAKALQIESGDIDMAQVTPKAAEKLKTNKEFTLHQMKTADYRAIAYNFKSPLFKENPELANILSYGIDREAIIQSVLLGQGQAAYSPLQLAEYNNAGIETFAYDGAKCESLLQAAGWAKGSDGYYAKNGQQLKFTISAMENDQVRVEMAKICAKNLQDIGVNADAQVKAELDWENQDACIIGWGSPFDPDDHTYKVFTTGAGDNYTGYSNPAMDKTLTAAREIENNDERIKLYQQFQTQMTEQMPYTFIAYVDANYAIKNNISGITEDTVLGHHGVGVFWNIAEWKIEK